MPTQPFALGAKPRNKKRSELKIENFKKSETGGATPIAQPEPIIYMQNQIPDCSKEASAQLINGLFTATVSPRFGWIELKKIDGIPLSEGTTMDWLFKQLEITSHCDLSLLNDDTLLDLNTYSSPSAITPLMAQNALPRVVSGAAYTDAPTFQQILAAAETFNGCILMVECGDGWWNPSWAEDAILPLKLGNYVDNHFVYVPSKARLATYGILQPNPNYIYFLNSWSTAWGHSGIGYFDQTYIPYVLEMGVALTTQQYVFNSNLYFGMMNNPDVRALQLFLGVTPATGNFGILTWNAVCKYQTVNKISSTGFVGVLTRASLNK